MSGDQILLSHHRSHFLNGILLSMDTDLRSLHILIDLIALCLDHLAFNLFIYFMLSDYFLFPRLIKC